MPEQTGVSLQRSQRASVVLAVVVLVLNALMCVGDCVVGLHMLSKKKLVLQCK